jgi:hypothetical protein
MNFMDRHGWRVSFLEQDCRTSLPLTLTFASADKIRAMVEQCGSQLLEDRQALEHAFEMRRGSAWLMLNEEQYMRLKNPGRIRR